MILTFASLLVLQLLSSISCRSLRLDESEKGKAGHVAHLLVPYHGSDGHKEDREIKVRLVPFKDDGSSKKHIAIHVTNPKQKTENLPVAIIVDSQGYKKGEGSKKKVPHIRKAKKKTLEGKRVKSRANEEPNRKKKSDESASVSNSDESDEGKLKVKGGSKHETFSKSESGELRKKETEESSSDSESGESGKLRKKESKESSKSVSNSAEGKRKVRGGSKHERVSKSESGELRKKETEESSSDLESGESGELRKKESKESSSGSTSDDSNDTRKNGNESKKDKSSSESQSDDSNESVQVDKRHFEALEEFTPNLREIIDSKILIDTDFSNYNSDDGSSYESSGQTKELTDDTSSSGSSYSSGSSTDVLTSDTSDSETYDGLDKNQEWREIINEHQLFTINDSFESKSGANTKESLSEVIDALIKAFSGEVVEQTSQEDTKESSNVETSDEESKEVSKSDKSSSEEVSAQSQSVEARKLQYITVETQSDEAGKALREAKSESLEASEPSESKESTTILDSEEIEKLLNLLDEKENDPSEESQTEETDSDASESESPTSSESEEHKERKKIKKKKETQCSSESTAKNNGEELSGELKKVEKYIIEAIASYFDTQDKEAKEEGKAYNLSFLFNKK